MAADMNSQLEDELDEIVLAYLKAVDAGQTPDTQEILAQHPELRSALEAFFEDQENVDRCSWRVKDSSVATHPSSVTGLNEPLIDGTGAYQGETPEASNADDPASVAIPERIGRYKVLKLLGQGGFGVVYLANDEQLQRLVAIKVPHSRLVSRPKEAEVYLTEARTVASLDHPSIVPVHDVGSTQDYPCYVVSKYIDGMDLAKTLKRSPLRLDEAADVVATVAEALHHAHKQGLVHRDIKPGNILLDRNGKPFVTDFGLALREQDVGKGPRFAGTPIYMSPEQARGEGHRVDGRSDIFSLGVVFYELLVGRRPFKGDDMEELLEQITDFEPRPPRQYNDSIPKELERICLKALSKRATERYTTAKDMVDDLRHFLAERSAGPIPTGHDKPAVEAQARLDSSDPSSVELKTPPSSSHLIKVVPKGLRERPRNWPMEPRTGTRNHRRLWNLQPFVSASNTRIQSPSPSELRPGGVNLVLPAFLNGDPLIDL
jgi:serine/threonine protein kinase